MVQKTTNRRGDSLLEILGVVTCIAILAVIAVVANSGRAAKALASQARSEVEALAAAEAKVAAETGVYVPLQVLDDPLRTGQNARRGVDDIAEEPAGVLGIDPTLGADSKPGEAKPVVETVKGKWQGPYHEFRRTFVGEPQKAETAGDWVGAVVRRDWPLDPWGTPYRFYSPLGVIGSQAAKSDAAALNTPAFGDGAVTTEDDRFNAFAIVSFGPDGKSDSVSNGNDDTIYLFPAEGGR